MSVGRKEFLKFMFLTVTAWFVSLALLVTGKVFFASTPSEFKPEGEEIKRENRIILPEPRLEGGISVEEAIQKRRSIREYSEEPLRIEELSNLLWAAQGITDQVNKFRSSPSAGATYPLEVYVAVKKGGVDGLKEGVYHYEPESHVLQKLSGVDLSNELSSAAVAQRWVRDAPINIILTCIYERTTTRYGDRGIRYVHMEAGHAAENVYLQSASLGLGTVVVGAFIDEHIQKLLNLPENCKPLYLIPVGRPLKTKK